MNISSITPNRITSQRLIIDKPTIFMVFPDTNIKIWDYIYKTNFLLANCSGIICPQKTISFMRKRINGKIHALEFKKKIIEIESSTKKLKVVGQAFEKEEKKKDYYFYDLSVYSDILTQNKDKFQPKFVVTELFSNITSVYQELKKNFPTYDVDLLFLIKDNLGYLNSLFQNIKMYLPKDSLEKMNFCDNFTFISTNNKYLIPIINKSEGKTLYIEKNIRKIPAYFVEDEIETKEQIVQDDQKKEEPKKEEQDDQKKEEQEEPKEKSKEKQIVDKLVTKELNVKNSIDEDGNIKVEINTPQLKKLLKIHNIDDPVILSNVKVALDNHLNKNNEQREKLNRGDAEKLILQVINKTIHGTDEIKEEYIHEPKKLFDKLKDIKTHQVPLRFPEYKNEITQPKNIIDLDYTCGQYRQKFEFTETVHKNVDKLFKTLENTTNFPIKIKNIDHQVVDNSKDRIIEYTITVQNMGGGYSKPYNLKLKIPGLVSERYFKIKDAHYIMKTQQFLKPLTKTDPNEVRLLSSYAIVRISLRNFKFAAADIEKIIKYISLKYPKMIKSVDDEKIIFNDDDIIGLAGNLVYKSKDIEINIDKNSSKLFDSNGKQLNVTKFEYQLDVLIDKLKQIDPSETLNKSQLKISYLEIYLGGLRLPLLLYLWSQKGLLNSLNDESIDYSIDEEIDGKASYSLKLKNNYLNIYPDNFRKKCLVNGLIVLALKSDYVVEGDVNNAESSYDIINNYTKASGALRLISLMTENEIDPITKDLLEFEGLSTNFVRLVSKDAVDMLFKNKPDNLSDLSIYRTRLSEMIFALMYKQLKMAHNKYRSRVFDFEDPEAKIEIHEDFIIQNLITTSGVLQNTEPFNPIDEISLSSRVIKTGKGGVPSKFAFKTEHRNIHPSSYGNLGAASTSESSDVGLVNHHTLTPAITNQYGNYGIRNLDGLKPWEILSLDESLTPFQNSMDSDRLVMARTHATQTVPIENSEIPLLVTGGEYITGQISSTRFIHRAKDDGKVLEVDPDKYISIQYKDGNIENLDIIPRKSRTKRGSFIQLEMKTLNIGDSFKKNDTLAWTKNFNQGVYSGGKNVTVCFMNYRGYCHEDSYTITDELANKVKRTIIKPINIVVPPNTKVLKIEDQKKHVDVNDILVEFVSDLGLEEYFKEQNFDLEDQELENMLLSQNSKSIKLHASFSGEIVDIKIFLNTKRDVDPKLLNMHKKLVKTDSELINKLSQNKNSDEKLSSLDNMDNAYFEIGGHKLKGGKEFLGANIVFYIREEHSITTGDKMTNRYGSKGVVSYLIDKDKEPQTQITQLKPEVFISPISIFSRKNIPFLKEIYIGKIFYFLQKQCMELASNPKITNDIISKKILGVYQILASEKIYKDVEKLLSSMNKIRQELKSNTFNLRLLVEPFTNIEMNKIKDAAEFIDIPLDEKVFIPELNAYTDIEVPVGIGYYTFTEHISEDFANIRGADIYTSLTKQPTKGKARSGGQSISGQDIYALLSLDADKCLNELLTLRSDDHKTKRKVYSDIISNGELSSMPTQTGGGGTTSLFNIYMKGMGLSVD